MQSGCLDGIEFYVCEFYIFTVEFEVLKEKITWNWVGLRWSWLDTHVAAYNHLTPQSISPISKTQMPKRNFFLPQIFHLHLRLPPFDWKTGCNGNPKNACKKHNKTPKENGAIPGQLSQVCGATGMTSSIFFPSYKPHFVNRIDQFSDSNLISSHHLSRCYQYYSFFPVKSIISPTKYW